MGSSVATPLKSASSTQLQKTEFPNTHLESLEKLIDFLDSKLPPLKNFILPGGGLTASHLHVARTVCRRAERSLVPLFLRGDIQEGITAYINRLSDFLFVAARFATMSEGKVESAYQKGKGKDDYVLFVDTRMRNNE
eukprot:TRINITY_DN1437_c0_g3_i4.p1 TRINITY_DN1437_c0_g3~~TRINITY_DN1437_c0_g3_i4.p1  ORF type:complete len:137 (+),score=18.27 TRINITY_DN1437_c0_g3_i4:429-839(+)